MELFWDIVHWLILHGSAIGLALTWITILFLYLRRRARWFQKEFEDQVTFSLNYVIGDALAMRTLLEAKADTVWLNPYGVKTLKNAARQTTAEQPFINLADDVDMGFVHRAVVNVLSERFASTFVAEALGVPVGVATFIFAITYERYEVMRTRKFRVLLI